MSSFLEFDYSIVRACLNNERYSWEDFVDRFMDLTLHVIEHTAARRGKTIDEPEKIELCEAIFRAYRYNNYQLLREFSFGIGVFNGRRAQNRVRVNGVTTRSPCAVLALCYNAGL